PHLRSVLTPTVAGIVVCVAGLSLITPGLTQFSGLDAGGRVDGTDILIGTATLLVIVTFSVWGNRYCKLFALLGGLLVGIALAAFLDRLHGLDSLATMPVF